MLKNSKTRPVLGLVIGIVLLSAAFFVAGCRKPGNPASMIGKELVCPVTGEGFKITAHSPSVEYQGKRYYFCCPGCDKKFLDDPEKYLSKTASQEMPMEMQSDSFRNHKPVPADSILYWTCSMHPTVRADKPGDCPICGMDLISVRKEEEGKIRVEEDKGTALGIASEPADMRTMVRTVHAPGKVANDQELYLAQQEYLAVYTLGGELYNSAKLKLARLGFAASQISDLEHAGKPDESLIYPSRVQAWILADIYEPDIGYIKRGQKTKITLPAQPGLILDGIIRAVQPALNPQTRSLTVRIQVPDQHTGLPMDAYADVEIAIPLGRRLAVPVSAIINTGTRKLVYVETADNTYEPRNVKTGDADDDLVEIIAGLKRGDRVVTQGNFLLDSQANIFGGQSLVYGSAEEVKQEPLPSSHQH